MSGRPADRDARRDAAFAQLFEAHWGAVRHHIEGVVAEDAEVAQLVSEVFLWAWARADTERPIGRIALLRATDRLLRRRAGRISMRRTAIDAVLSRMTGDDEQPGLLGRAEVVRALGVLAPRERRIIMLTHWDGLAAGEIAQLLRMSEFRVRRMRDRARDRLRTELGLEGAARGED